jgi:hypothetical protein
MTLGMNLAMPSYYGGERAFMNLLAGSGWYYSSPTIAYGPIPASRLNMDGEVTSLLSGEKATRILSLPNGAYAGNTVRVKCSWLGNGTVQMANWVAKNISTGGNSLSFDWVPMGRQNAHINLMATDPSNPVRKLDCREASADPSAVFHPDFIQSLKRYSHVRFMDWQNTNRNQPVTWNTRTTPNSALNFGADGVALEHMVAVANAADVDPWFTVPWNADDDYVRRFASYVRDNLNPNLKAYVETSNEVWNGMFPVAKQALTEGRAENLSSNDFQAQMLRYAEKSTSVAKVWTTVFSGQPSRLVRVVSSMNVSAWVTSQILGFKDTAQYVDAVATAPYFGHNVFSGTYSTLTDLGTIFSRLDSEIDVAMSGAQANADLAKKYGKRFITYEAGQHIVIGDVVLQQSIQRDPRMATIYARYLNNWKDKFGDSLVLFSDIGSISKYGAWGAQEYVGQPIDNAPKMQSIASFAAMIK